MPYRPSTTAPTLQPMALRLATTPRCAMRSTARRMLILAAGEFELGELPLTDPWWHYYH